VTIREALRTATERLELHLVSNARLTAEVLLAHSLSVNREYIYTHDERALSAEELQSLEDHIYDRISGVPLQYIVGRQEFYGRFFRVTPAVLIPRPETEYIVDSVLESGSQGHRILDVGTGSGCIAVTLALELENSEVFASDISEDALHVARSNAVDLGASVGFVCTDVVDGISGRFDFIVSNPPYVRPADISKLQREVRDHEPHVALFSPADELTIYRRLIDGASVLLRPGGHLIMEIGLGMEERILALLEAGWAKLPTKADLQGIPRTIRAIRLCPTERCESIG
jgi:release factor glutamine methyltransferase